MANNFIKILGEKVNDSTDCIPVIKKSKVDHERFRITEILCYENYDPKKESGTVNFSSFNPIHPILACGLTHGNILFIEGESQSDLVRTWKSTRRLQTEETSAMTDFGWNVDGTLLAATFLDGKVVLWNRKTDALVEVKDAQGEQVWAIEWNQYSPNRFATRNNQVILVWDNAQAFPKILTQRFKFHTNIIRDVVWISEDQFTSCSDDGLIILFQIERESPLKSFNLGDAVIALSWNDTLNLLGSLTRDGTIQVWAMDKIEPNLVVKNERMKRPNCITWCPCGSTATEMANSLIAWLDFSKDCYSS